MTDMASDFANESCKLVAGTIDPNGWCNKFERK